MPLSPNLDREELLGSSRDAHQEPQWLIWDTGPSYWSVWIGRQLWELDLDEACKKKKKKLEETACSHLGFLRKSVLICKETVHDIVCPTRKHKTHYQPPKAGCCLSLASLKSVRKQGQMPGHFHHRIKGSTMEKRSMWPETGSLASTSWDTQGLQYMSSGCVNCHCQDKQTDRVSHSGTHCPHAWCGTDGKMLIACNNIVPRITCIRNTQQFIYTN